MCLRRFVLEKHYRFCALIRRWLLSNRCACGQRQHAENNPPNSPPNLPMQFEKVHEFGS
jgi:hypothetical protein